MEVSEAHRSLATLLGHNLIKRDDVHAAERSLSGDKTIFGFSKFERNAAVASYLYSKFGNDIPPEVYRAALFYEAPQRALSRLPARAKVIAEAANSLSEARGQPEEFAQKLVDLSSIDALLINSANLLLGLRRAASAPKDSSLRVNVKLRERVKQVADMALNFYVPTLDIVGLRELKGEIGEAAFRLQNPRLHMKIDRALTKVERKLIPHSLQLEQIVREHANRIGCEFRIKPRPRKQVYSAYLKMKKKDLKEVRELNDVVGFRVVLYPPATASGIDKVRELSNRLERDPRLKVVDHRDYLGLREKPNGYAARHLMVAHPRTGLTAEIQIQTDEMQRKANDAKAAHALHKGVHLTVDTVAQIEAIGRNAVPELASPELMPVKVVYLGGKGIADRLVKVYPGAPLLRVVADALKPEELVGGLKFKLMHGGRTIRGPSLYYSIPAGATIQVTKDPNGVHPSSRWLNIVGRHPNIRAAYVLHMGKKVGKS